MSSLSKKYSAPQRTLGLSLQPFGLNSRIPQIFKVPAAAASLSLGAFSAQAVLGMLGSVAAYAQSLPPNAQTMPQTHLAASSSAPYRLALPAAANPLSPVVPLSYQSAFEGLPPFDPDQPNADRSDWRTANELVGRNTRGHIDLLKWEEAEAAKRMGAATKPTAPAASPAPPASLSPSTRPAMPNQLHHGGHK